MSMFAHYDTNGTIVAFTLDGKAYGDFPANNIKIDDDQWQDCLSNPTKWIVTSGQLQLAHQPGAPQLLEDAKTLQIQQINRSCNEAMAVIVAPYPPLEMQTWPNQLAEANAYQLNSAAPTPTLSAIAMASGETVATLAASVVSKAAAYTVASGAAVGKRQALTAAINSATTVSAVKAIVW